MAPSRPRPGVVGSTKAVNALRALARLLARQAAREAVAAFSNAAAPGTEAVTGATIATDISTAALAMAEQPWAGVTQRVVCQLASSRSRKSRRFVVSPPARSADGSIKTNCRQFGSAASCGSRSVTCSNFSTATGPAIDVRVSP